MSRQVHGLLEHVQDLSLFKKQVLAQVQCPQLLWANAYVFINNDLVYIEECFIIIGLHGDYQETAPA